VDGALAEWDRVVTGVFEQGEALIKSAQVEAEGVVKRCSDKVAALEALIQAADRDNRHRLQGELLRARRLHEQALRALRRIGEVARAVRVLKRSHGSEGGPLVAEARAQLGAMALGLDGYHRQGAVGAMERSVTSPAKAEGVSQLSRLGLTDLDVGAADLADTPIVGAFGKGGLSRADYRWAVQAWSDIVGPGVERGMTRSDFSDRDERIGAPPLRRMSDVYDMFLGADRIRVDRQADGSLNIVNGRHRLQVARDLGIKSLPGEVS
jgi:hypothetical protein